MTARAAAIAVAFGAAITGAAIYIHQHTKPVTVTVPATEEKPLGWDDPDGFPWELKGQRKPTDMHYSKVIAYYPLEKICLAARLRWMERNKPLRARCQERELKP